MKKGKLSGAVRCDVLIIGAGMAGLLCGYMLKEQGIDCIVCEADNIGGGVSHYTTGKVTAQHGLIYSRLLMSKGEETARAYLNANLDAVERIKELCRKIGSGFDEKSSFVYSCTSRRELEAEQSALSSIGYNAPLVQRIPIPVDCVGALEFTSQGQIDARDVMNKLAESLTVYENSRIVHIEKDRAYTDNGVIYADSIIVATHFPIVNKHGMYFLKMYQERSYFIALENAEDPCGMYIGTNGGLSFRYMDNRLFIGGGAHRTGKEGRCWRAAEDFAEKNYGDARIVARWATQDCITLDGMPYIGLYSKSTPEMYVATGFNKWGMSGSMVSAMILSDALQGRNNKYASVFSPQRSMLQKGVLTNMAEAVGGIVNFKTKRCSHMGCALEYNKYEKTWDCPCHGSRFDRNGKIEDGPAMKNISAPGDEEQ